MDGLLRSPRERGNDTLNHYPTVADKIYRVEGIHWFCHFLENSLDREGTSTIGLVDDGTSAQWLLRESSTETMGAENQYG
jgi:hypothetical protein